MMRWPWRVKQHFEDVLESMKLKGAKDIDSTRLRANDKDREFQKAHVKRVHFVPQLGDEVDVFRTGQS